MTETQIKYRATYFKQFGEPERVLRDDAPGIPYRVINFNPGACHQGQRKLYYSELEYFTMIMKAENTTNLSKFLCVYIGASPGDHLVPLMELLPTTKWLLYDVNPSNAANDASRVKFMDRYMTDDEIPIVLRFAAGREIIFITDIRINTEESNVFNDMIIQQKWGINMNAKYMLIKYRPPYIMTDNTAIDCTYDYSDFGDKIKIINEPPSKYSILYLEGDILFQIYAPKTSSECRLYVVRPKDGIWRLKYYDYSDYEEQCTYFNVVLRRSHYEYKNSKDIINYFIGYDDSYESVCEYMITYNYFEVKHTINNTATDLHHTTIKELHRANIFLMKMSKTSVITAIYKTFMVIFRSTDEKMLLSLYGGKLLAATAMFLQVCKTVAESANAQFDLVKNRLKEPNSILTEEEFAEQYATLEMCKSLYGWFNGKFQINRQREKDVIDILRKTAKVCDDFLSSIERLDQIPLNNI